MYQVVVTSSEAMEKDICFLNLRVCLWLGIRMVSIEILRPPISS